MEECLCNLETTSVFFFPLRKFIAFIYFWCGPFFREGNGTPLQYSCLENPMDGGAWWAAVHGVARVGHDWVTSLYFSLSCTGEGNGNPLQCSCLEHPRDGEAWWAAVYGVAQSRTRLKRLSSSSSSRTICKSLYWICYNITSVVCILFCWSRGMWDLSFPARDGTHTPAMESEVLTPGPPGEVLELLQT